MRYKAEQRDITKRRILESATNSYRKYGLNGLGIGALMKSMGLTHGGFYLHFQSKTDLFLQLISKRLRDVAHQILNIKKEHKTKHLSYEKVISDYLSSTHSKNIAEGCLLGALSNDIARLSENEKAIFQDALDEWLASYIALCNGDRDKGILTISAMLGALQLSRLQCNDERASDILLSVKESLLENG